MAFAMLIFCFSWFARKAVLSFFDFFLFKCDGKWATTDRSYVFFAKYTATL